MKPSSTFIVTLLLISSLLSFRCEEETPAETYITFESPNGGENWLVGTTQTITWKSAGVSGDVKIEISADGGATYAPLFSGTPDDGRESWYVTGPTTTNAKLKITSLTESAISDVTDSPFTIYEAISGPTNLQATIGVNNHVVLTWQDNSLTEEGFRIERKIGAGGSWGLLASVTANAVTYTDAGMISNYRYYYRVRAYTTTTISGESNVVSKVIGWIQQPSGTTAQLYGIAYSSANNGVAVGQNGIILRTTNGGDEWTQVSSGTANTLYAVAFLNANVGSAVGAQGVILRTSDGGASWSSQNVGGAPYYYKGIDYSSTTDGYIAGYHIDQVLDTTWGIVLRTTDAGVNWSVVTEQWRYSFEDISFPVPGTGTVVGSVSNGHNAIYRTTNNGQIWVKQTNEGLYPLLGVHFASSNFGVAVGREGMIYRTSNGGGIWEDHSFATPKTLRRVAFGDANRGLAIGDDGLLIRTTDGGFNWSVQPAGTNQTLFGLYLSDVYSQTVVGAGGIILKTDNGGAP